MILRGISGLGVFLHDISRPQQLPSWVLGLDGKSQNQPQISTKEGGYFRLKYFPPRQDICIGSSILVLELVQLGLRRSEEVLGATTALPDHQYHVISSHKPFW